MKYVLSAVLGLVVVLLIISILSEDETTPEANAVVTRIEGVAYLVTKEAPAGRLINNYDVVTKDDQVKVQENSRLELRLPEGTIIRLSENARFTMRLVKFEKRTGDLAMQGFLQSGKLWAKVKKLATPGSRVEVLTSAGLAAAKGTVYGVDREADESTTIKVYEGVVLAVHAQGEGPQAAGQTGLPVSVNAFQKVSVSAREGVSSTQDFDPKATIDDWTRWNHQRDAREGLVSIKVAPASSTISRGVSLQLNGTAFYSDNTVKDITWFATWSSTDHNVVAIDQSGVATGGRQPGPADLSAAIVDMKGSAAISVTRELLAITVTPASRSIVNGSSQQFTATARFSDNTTKDITSSAVWTSSDTRVVAIEAGGRATAGDKAGTAVIKASLGNRSGSAPLKVRRELLSIAVLPGGATIMEGKTQQFSAIGTYSDKTTENLTSSAKWQLTDPKVAGVSGAGLVTGRPEGGTATISATFGGKIGTGTITVSTRELLSLIVSPAEVMIHQMESQQFTVQGSFSDGSTQDLT
ncbi:MAG TPA: Ig-like domain-containing protein, partial [Nitrospirota bacterium]|nr:Ig-like domain-containing protein [Nitrospirota bacterium]